MIMAAKEAGGGESENWARIPLGQIARIKTGSKNNEDKIADGTYPFFVRSATVERINTYAYDCEAILIPGEGGIGSIFHYVNGRFDVHQRVYAITSFDEDVSPRYVYYYLAQHFGRHAMRHTVKATVDSLRLPTFQNFEITLPRTRNEQEAIADALSAADAYIESLEQLLAKKRAVMQGAMQELLTGKRRLPGFSSEWNQNPIGAIAPLQRGFDLPTSQLRNGPYPIVYSNGIGNYHAAAKVKGPGVVTGRSGTLGEVHFIKGAYWPHNTTLWVTDFRGNDPRYIYYLYRFIDFQRFSSGSGVPTLNRNDAHAYGTRLPSDPSEQQAIAKILSDMDTDIRQIEVKIQKARDIKQGMMQELLTGRVRLI